MKVMINFYVREVTRSRFDEVCRAGGKTRTQVLNELMEDFVIASTAALEKRCQELNAADERIAAVNSIRHRHDEVEDAGEWELPLPFWSGQDEGSDLFL